MSLSRLAAYLDTWDGASKAARFSKGWPAATRPDIRFFNTKKVQYRYREAGSGRTLVFLADPPATLEFYDEMLSIFAPHFRVVVFEPPAMGFSAARPGYGFGFHETADDLARFLEAVAGPGSVLAFSCVAGLAAVDIAGRRPDLVSALTLFQTTDWDGFQVWKAKRDPKKVLGKPFIGQLVMRRLAKSRAPAWFDLAMGDREKYPSFCTCAQETIGQGAQWTLASAYQRFLHGKTSPLASPTQPTLIVWGAADGSHDADAPIRARRLAPRSQVEVLEGIGHFPELENPQRALALIDNFLSAQ